MLTVSVLNDYPENWEAKALIKCDPSSYSTKTSYTLDAEKRWMESTPLLQCFPLNVVLYIQNRKHSTSFFPIEDNPGICLRHHPGLVIRNTWNWLHEQTEEHLLVAWPESFHFSPSKSQKPTHPGYESFYPHVQFLSFYYFTVSQCERRGGNSSLRNAINFKEVRFKRLQIRF